MSSEGDTVGFLSLLLRWDRNLLSILLHISSSGPADAFLDCPNKMAICTCILLLYVQCRYTVVSHVADDISLWNSAGQRSSVRVQCVCVSFQSTPSAGSIMFYFMTNELKFGPELLGRMALFQSIASLLGILTYMWFFTTTSLRKLLFVSTLVVTPFCLLPVIV